MWPSVMAFTGTDTAFSEDGKEVTVHEFVDNIQEVAKMGLGQDAYKVRVSNCSFPGVAYDLICRDERAKESKRFQELKEANLKRSGVEPQSTKLQHLLAVHQTQDEDVQTYTT